MAGDRRGQRTGPRRWLVLTAAGTELAVAVAAGLLAGNWLDDRGLARWTGFPAGLLGGAILGFAAGMYNLARLVSWANRDPEARDPDD